MTSFRLVQARSPFSILELMRSSSIWHAQVWLPCYDLGLASQIYVRCCSRSKIGRTNTNAQSVSQELVVRNMQSRIYSRWKKLLKLAKFTCVSEALEIKGIKGVLLLGVWTIVDGLISPATFSLSAEQEASSSWYTDKTFSALDAYNPSCLVRIMQQVIWITYMSYSLPAHIVKPWPL